MSVLQDNRNLPRENLRHRQTVFGRPARRDVCLCGRCQALLALLLLTLFKEPQSVSMLTYNLHC